MEFKGTQGKWKLGKEEKCKKFNQPVINIKTNEIESFVTLYSGLAFESDLDDETKYNALLISKAPEMVYIINELIEELSFHGFNNSTSISKAKQLIKDATEL